MWEAYFESVESSGATPVLSNPLKTRMIAEATIKTDQLDSATRATLLRLDALPTAFAPPAAVRQLRHLVRDRLFYRRNMGMRIDHAYGQTIYRGIAYESGSLRRRSRAARRPASWTSNRCLGRCTRSSTCLRGRRSSIDESMRPSLNRSGPSFSGPFPASESLPRSRWWPSSVPYPGAPAWTRSAPPRVSCLRLISPGAPGTTGSRRGTATDCSSPS